MENTKMLSFREIELLLFHGRLIKVEQVGDYQFASFHPYIRKGVEITKIPNYDVINYIGIFNGKESPIYETLERCIVSTIAIFKGNDDEIAGHYFCKMIGIE